MASTAKNILDYLVAQGVGTAGTTLFRNTLPKGTTQGFCIRDTGGFSPDLALNPGNIVRKPTIQIYGRGSKYSFDSTYSKMEEIRDLIDQKYNLTINNTRYISIHIFDGISDMGLDTNECPEYVMNFVLEVG